MSTIRVTERANHSDLLGKVCKSTNDERVTTTLEELLNGNNSYYKETFLFEPHGRTRRKQEQHPQRILELLGGI